MWLIFAEALAAFLVFALIVWWTMFCGRKPPNDEEQREE